jgi:hypothetical protein
VSQIPKPVSGNFQRKLLATVYNGGDDWFEASNYLTDAIGMIDVADESAPAPENHGEYG